jgi:hypothetical protein
MRLLAVVLGVVGVMLVSAAPSVAQTTLPYQCSPEPADCTGWYRSDVTVTWTDPALGCSVTTITSDTAGTDVSCPLAVPSTVTIHRDATPPAISVAPDRPPDHAGWYTAPVTVSFAWSDGTSGLGSCSP